MISREYETSLQHIYCNSGTLFWGVNKGDRNKISKMSILIESSPWMSCIKTKLIYYSLGKLRMT